MKSGDAERPDKPLKLKFAHGKALGAISGQLSQALSSFVLQLLAARLLGASGLGEFALAYSVIMMSTAIGSGMVGDSLTILDRHQPALRAALQSWGLLVPVATGVVSAIAVILTGLMPLEPGILFGLALAAFLVETTMRRLLMASMRFWSLVIVDLSVSSPRSPLSLLLRPSAR